MCKPGCTVTPMHCFYFHTSLRMSEYLSSLMKDGPVLPIMSNPALYNSRSDIAKLPLKALLLVFKGKLSHLLFEAIVCDRR